MTLSQQDAADALRDIDAAQARSAMLRGYQHAAPHFILWGILWAVGYGLTDAFPREANAIWAVIVPIGVIAGLLATRRGRFGSRYGGAMLAVLLFIAASLFVMWPVTGQQIAAFIPLLIALTYALFGIWAGSRYVVAGAAVAALTLAGFVLFAAHFFLWMAVVGGGAMVLAGIWLRRA